MSHHVRLRVLLTLLIVSSLAALALHGRGLAHESSRRSPLDAGRPRAVCAAVILPDRHFRAGEVIPFTFRVHNRTFRTLVYWHTAFYLTHAVEVRDERGLEPPLTPEGRRWRDYFGSPHRRGNVDVPIEPGRSYDDSPYPGLEGLFTLKPGRYTVRILFPGSDPTIPHDLNTAPVSLVIDRG